MYAALLDGDNNDDCLFISVNNMAWFYRYRWCKLITTFNRFAQPVVSVIHAHTLNGMILLNLKDNVHPFCYFN